MSAGEHPTVLLPTSDEIVAILAKCELAGREFEAALAKVRTAGLGEKDERPAVDAAKVACIDMLQSFGLLFQNNDAAVHTIIKSLVGLLHDARLGVTGHHILLQGRELRAGSRDGIYKDSIAAFAISAVRLLLEHHCHSEPNWPDACEEVAKWLTRAGFSFQKTGSLKTPITARTVENWLNGPKEYPFAHQLSVNFKSQFTQGIINLDTDDPAAVRAYLKNEAEGLPEALKLFRIEE